MGISNKIKVSIIYGDKLVNMDTSLFEFIVYKNFLHLGNNTDQNKFNHNTKEINRLCHDNSSFAVVAIADGNIVGYILGEVVELDKFNPQDTRTVCYVTYIYTVNSYRNRGIATCLLDVLKKWGKEKNCEGVMLTYDTHNNSLVRFYNKYGFNRDIFMTTGNRWDVYYRRYY
jgi:ribosomal protein S18 acetylase RimI-like enzyme